MSCQQELHEVKKRIVYLKVALHRSNQKILFFQAMIKKLSNGTINEEETLLLWRRLRDKANKDKDIQYAMVKNAIMGGIAPSILTGMGEEDV